MLASGQIMMPTSFFVVRRRPRECMIPSTTHGPNYAPHDAAAVRSGPCRIRWPNVGCPDAVRASWRPCSCGDDRLEDTGHRGRGFDDRNHDARCYPSEPRHHLDPDSKDHSGRYLNSPHATYVVEDRATLADRYRGCSWRSDRPCNDTKR